VEYLRKRKCRADTRSSKIFIPATFIAPEISGNGTADHEAAVAASGEGHVGSLAERVKQLLANHPPLTAEQRARIGGVASLIPGTPRSR
jgi:hypothetical protein